MISKTKIHPFDMIISLYIFGIVVAQLMSAKVVPLIEVFGIPVSISVAIFLMPFLFTITDVVVEVYGKSRARSLVRTGLMIVVLLALYTIFVTSLPPAERFQSQNSAYVAIFGTSIQFALASIAAFASAELIDVMIYSKLREKMKNRGMWMRNNLSNFVGQFIDSTVFVVIAFYSFEMPIANNLSFLIGIIIPYWLVRCLMSVFGTPLVYLGVAYLRKSSHTGGQLDSEFATMSK